MIARSAIVLGAGMVGVSAAVHLRHRGWSVALVDNRAPGEGASFGNGGLIQREAVFPRAFPRRLSELARIAGNRTVEAAYHPGALPGLAAPLLRYWRQSEPRRYRDAVAGHARLIATCVDEHVALAREAGALALLRPLGLLHTYNRPDELDAALALAEQARREHGVNYRALDASAVAGAEPSLQVGRLGAVHWTDPLSVGDPHALVLAYARLFTEKGGTLLTGDALALEPAGRGWRVPTVAGAVEAEHAVVALGAGSARLTGRFGYAPPTFGKRGYHMHYALRGNAVLNRPVLDNESGFLLAPMHRGVRLTTGAEFARPDAPPTPVQLARAEPLARGLLPLGDRVDETSWMGVRPCTPDMLPIIGPTPGRAGLWCAFGHAHQGFTLGPTTGRLLADLMEDEAPFLDPESYRPDRFQ